MYHICLHNCLEPRLSFQDSRTTALIFSVSHASITSGPLPWDVYGSHAKNEHVPQNAKLTQVSVLCTAIQFIMEVMQVFIKDTE